MDDYDETHRRNVSKPVKDYKEKVGRIYYEQNSVCRDASFGN